MTAEGIRMGASVKKIETGAGPGAGGAGDIRSIQDLAALVNRISGVQLGDRQKFMIEMRI